MLVAAWGGIVAFVGPTFDFDMGDTSRAWVWNQSHALLHAAPGVVGVVGGFLMLIAMPWALARLGALLALASGAWFVIGPTVEPLWRESASATAGPLGSSGTTLHRVLEGIGYQYGTGVVLVMLAAFALGLLAPAPARAASSAVTTPEPRPSFNRARHA
jgi:hypothetical protein